MSENSCGDGVLQCQRNSIFDWLSTCSSPQLSARSTQHFQPSASRTDAAARDCRAIQRRLWPRPRSASGIAMEDNQRVQGNRHGRERGRGSPRRSPRKAQSDVQEESSRLSDHVSKMKLSKSPEDNDSDQDSSRITTPSITTLDKTNTFTAPTESTRISHPQSPSRWNSTTRSQSPTKRKVDLLRATPQIQFKDMDNALDSPEILRLHRKLMGIYDSAAVIPLCVKDLLDPIEANLLFERHFDHDAPELTESRRTTFRQLREIRHAAFECNQRQKPEGSWCFHVFGKLLELAVELENSNNEQNVQLEEVSTTCISPPSLIPTGFADLPFQSKRVDFGVYVTQTKDEEGCTEKLIGVGTTKVEDLSVNQTSAHYVRLLPQIVAVEAKRALAVTEAEVQLGIWMAALRNRLEDLQARIRVRQEALLEMQAKRKQSKTSEKKASSSMQLPSPDKLRPLPCLQLEGHVWNLYWCGIGPDGETVFYGSELGKTTSMKGMYQILAGLRVIIRYGRDEYYPWFKRAVLGLDNHDAA